MKESYPFCLPLFFHSKGKNLEIHFSFKWINFSIDLGWKGIYLSGAFKKEFTIASIDTGKLHFITCGNSECKSIFVVDSFIHSINPDFLCPACQANSRINHIVQCRSCFSILGLYKTPEGEEPNVFYVDKCHKCIGTTEDELRIQPFMFPNLML